VTNYKFMSNLIGAVVKTNNMKSDFSHYDDNEDDVEVEGMIIERVEDTNGVSYLVMDEDGLVYQTAFDDIDKVIRFGGNPATYLKPINL